MHSIKNCIRYFCVLPCWQFSQPFCCAVDHLNGQIMLQIWPFLKLFKENKMVWSFGLLSAFFECWGKLYFLRPVLAKKFSKIFNIFSNYKFCSRYFRKFSQKLLTANFGFLDISRPGNPDSVSRFVIVDFVVAKSRIFLKTFLKD